MHAVSTNQIADILHFNEKVFYAVLNLILNIFFLDKPKNQCSNEF